MAAFTRSPLRAAIGEADLEALAGALSRHPSEKTLLAAASDLFASGTVASFRRRALALMIDHGLDVNAVTCEPVLATHANQPPAHAAESLRAPPAQAPRGGSDWGLPLASRAALVDAPLLAWLLARGANPALGVLAQPLAINSAKELFGSAWSCAAALAGTDQGRGALEALLAHASGVLDDPALLRDIFYALVRPGTPNCARPWTCEHAREFLDALGPRMPALDRQAWADLLGDAMPWSQAHTFPAVADRVAVLAQALPPVALAGLFDASRAHNYDLRGLALEQDLAGHPQLWETLQAHADTLDLAAHPDWAQVRVAVRDTPLDNPRWEEGPVGALGYMMLLARWPATSPQVCERADAWARAGGKDKDRGVAGLTLGQARWAKTPASRGAPMDYLVRSPCWWAANPRTGQNPAHTCAFPRDMLSWTQTLAGRLDFQAVDHCGEEAGAWLLARATQSSRGIEMAIKALDGGHFMPVGQAGGRPASAWVGFHAGLRKAYDKAAKAHGVRGARRNRSQWRIHAAAQSMSVPQVRSAVFSVPPAQRASAVAQVDPMGMTPLSWWARAQMERLRNGDPSAAWQSRAGQVFDYLTGKDVPIWAPGMATHPYVDLLARGDVLEQRHSWPCFAVSALARDFGRLLASPQCPPAALDGLCAAWLARSRAEGWATAWKDMALPAPVLGAFVVKVLEDFATPKDSPHWAMFSSLRELLATWKKAGFELGPQDLPGPALAQACTALLATGSDDAPAIVALEPLATALLAQRLDDTLAQAPGPACLPFRARM